MVVLGRSPGESFKFVLPLPICIMALLKRTSPYHRGRSVVGAVNDIRILHGVYRKFTVQNDW